MNEEEHLFAEVDQICQHVRFVLLAEAAEWGVHDDRCSTGCVAIQRTDKRERDDLLLAG